VLRCNGFALLAELSKKIGQSGGDFLVRFAIGCDFIASGNFRIVYRFDLFVTEGGYNAVVMILME